MKTYIQSSLFRFLMMILTAISFSVCYIDLINVMIKKNNIYLHLNTCLIFSICFIIFLIINIFLFRKKIKVNKYIVILSILMSIFIYIGDSYRTYDTLISTNIIYIFGYFYFFLYLFYYLINIIKKWKQEEDIKNTFIRKHIFLISIITLVLGWAIYHIAFYPMILSKDPSFQLLQALGERTKYSDYSVLLDPNVNITNHHPVLHTLFLGSCLKLGRLLVNDNFGLYIYVFIQSIFMIFTLSYTLVFMKKYGVKTRYLLIVLCLYTFLPFFPLYSLNANKDVYFSLFIVWLVMILFSIIYGKEKQISIRKCILLFVILLLMSLFRNNGIYLVCLLFPFVIYYLKNNRLKVLTVFGLVIVLFFSYTNILLPYFKITPGSDREKLSVFFQQTARYIKYNEKDLSKKDKKYINKVLNYKTVKRKYNPNLSDPVKNTYRLTVTKKDMSNYYKVWFKGLIKHPYTYVDATINNTYGYFDPLEKHWYVYTDYCDVVNGKIDYHYNSLYELRKIISIYGGVMHYVPIISLLTSISFYVFILLSMSIYLLFKKKYKYLIVLNPLLVSLLVCISSPANTYFRYAMPIIFSIPLVVGLWLVIDKNRNAYL